MQPATIAPPRPVVARGSRASRTPLVLAALVLVLLAGIGVLVASQLNDGSGPRAATDPGASPTAAAGGSGSTKAVPAGWVTHRSSGWTVAVPPSYAVGSFNGFPQYKDRANGRTLRVSTTPAGGGKSDAVQDRRDQAAMFSASHGDYREIAIKKADYRGLEAADWEFTYSDGGASLHALDRVFVAGDRGYSLFFQTRSTDDWDAARSDFDKIAAAFQP